MRYSSQHILRCQAPQPVQNPQTPHKRWQNYFSKPGVLYVSTLYN